MVPAITARDEMIARAEIATARRPDQVRNAVEPARLDAMAVRARTVGDRRPLEAMTATVEAVPAQGVPPSEGALPSEGARLRVAVE